MASPLVVVDPKGEGKVLETSQSKSKKRKLVKTSEEEPKKTKLLASTTLAVVAVEVCLCLYLDVFNAFVGLLFRKFM